MDNTQLEIAKAFANLSALKKNVVNEDKSAVDRKYVQMYNTEVSRLEKIGFAVSEYKIEDSELYHPVISFNYLSGEKQYSERQVVRGAYFQTKIDSLLTLFSLLQSNTEGSRLV